MNLTSLLLAGGDGDGERRRSALHFSIPNSLKWQAATSQANRLLITTINSNANVNMLITATRAEVPCEKFSTCSQHETGTRLYSKHQREKDREEERKAHIEIINSKMMYSLIVRYKSFEHVQFILGALFSVLPHFFLLFPTCRFVVVILLFFLFVFISIQTLFL